jgi:hypothetical protein
MIKIFFSSIRLHDIEPGVTTYPDVQKKLFPIPKIVHRRSAKKTAKKYKYFFK